MGFVEYASILKTTKSELHDMGFKNKTDKAYIHEDGLSYLVHYEKKMKNNRNNIRFLEIGVRDGASLLTWNDYFINSTIVGIDIDKGCNKLENYNNIRVIIGDGTKKEIFNNDELNKKFDYILDDGSHYVKDIIKTFDMLFDKLTSEGIYIIEDLDSVERISEKGEYDYMKKYLQEKTDGYTITYYPRMLIISKKI